MQLSIDIDIALSGVIVTFGGLPKKVILQKRKQTIQNVINMS